MTSTDYAEHVVVAAKDGILHIRMNRPDKLNALTRAMYLTMADALAAADRDDGIRAILISGSDSCFTAGNDLEDFRAAGKGSGKRPLNPFLPAISRTQKPIVAAVSGVAVGIGTTMLLHCDLVYAGISARFRLPFVNLGLCPELGSSLLLPQLMGYQRAAELILLGEPFGAKTAMELGLVNAVCTDETIIETARACAGRLASRPPAAMRQAKMLLKRPREAALQLAMTEELEQFSRCLQSAEAAEALQAFAERRQPDFSRFS